MSPTVSGPIPKWLVIVFVGVALVGFLDAAYLTAEHFRGVIPPCGLTVGCQEVLTSQYAAIAGVPVAVLGILFYGALLVLVIAYLDTAHARVLRTAAWLSLAGFLGTLYLVFLQAFVLGAFCQYCLVSAASSVVLFAVGMRILRAR